MHVDREVCNNYCHLLIKDKSTTRVTHPQTTRSVQWIVIIKNAFGNRGTEAGPRYKSV